MAYESYVLVCGGTACCSSGGTSVVEAFKNELEAAGLKATGHNPDTGLVEVVELPTHPFFIGTQFHPEYKSTPENPHPLFNGLVQAALKVKE